MGNVRRTARIVATSMALAGVVALPACAQDALPRVTPAEAGLSPASMDAVTALVSQYVEEGRIAGAVVGVARNGSIGYLESVGVQDIASDQPMSEQTLFRIYSMTKAVTAVAVMMLHEEGRFELSDPVSAYLPAFDRVTVLGDDGAPRPPVRPVTVEHLLLHTAGLSHRSSAEYREADVRSRSISLEQFVENVVSVPLRFDPGDRYLYSASPTVLGRLVEVWSGQPFDVFLRERIFEPLDMSDTGFWVPPESVDRLATVYSGRDGGLDPYEIEEVPFTVRPDLLEGAVGLLSTVPDFLRFSQMLLNGGELGGVRLLDEGTVELMTRNGLPASIMGQRRGGSGWGLGNVSVVVDASAAEAGAVEGEYRWDGSAGTEFWVDPSTGTVVVTMWQNAPANPGSLRQQIRALVREAALERP